MLTTRFIRGLVGVAALALSILIAPASVEGQGCGHGGTPAFGADDVLWGTLRPTDIGQLPAERDSTNYHGQTRPDWRFPLFSGLDIEGNYAFTSYSTGFKIWDISAPNNQRNPMELAGRDGWQGSFLNWDQGNLEVRERLWDVDVPDGNNTVAVVAGLSPAGIAVWGTSDKTSPVQKYQDTSPTSRDVYTAVIGGTSYAFLASFAGGANGVHVYDLTKALSLTTPCVEDHTTGAACLVGNERIYRGRVGANQWALYIQGLAHSNGKHFLAVSSATAVKGVEIWDVSNPSSPVNLRAGGGRFFSTEAVFGVTMWQQGGSSYLAMQRTSAGQTRAEIYDISTCLTAGACSSLDSLRRWSSPALGGSGAYRFTTFSRDGGVPYIYLGVEDMCSGGSRREHLFDVSNPSSPAERGAEAGTVTIEGTPIDYWSWYYEGNPTGFSFVMPRHARFKDGFLYRAAWTVFDVHQRGTTTPTINVSGPTTGYLGEAQPFTAQALNCTPTANGWVWTTNGGTGSSTSSSINVTWATLGNKTVTATNSGCSGASPGSATIGILDPSPAIGSVTASPTSAPVCTPITFTGNDITGLEPLTNSWTIEQGGNPLPGAPHGGDVNPFVWDTTTISPGTYRAVLTVSGTGSPATANSPNVTLTALPPLPSAGWTITNDPFTAGTVQFHANLPPGTGATQWRWDFGDGNVLVTSDPAQGTNPTHSYTAVGDYDIVLGVRNCLTPNYVNSDPLSIDVTQIDPLVINQFQANCPFGFCTVNVNQPITFTTVVSGDPDFYDYDWDGNGSFEDAGNTVPDATHTYPVAGTFRPVLKIRRGAESVSFEHPSNIVVQSSTQPQPSISISGPGSGNVGTAVVLNATASNCSPASSGWTWTTSGAAGASTSSSISLTWNSAGTKTVTARNSSCGAASGTKTVTIAGDGGGGGDVLNANFTFTPASPTVGQVVTFDGRSSTGEIGTYNWNFGDGSTATGSVASHAYANPGTYNVSLTVSTAICTSPACANAEVKTVTVIGTGSECAANAQTICLLNGRFQVKVRFRDHHNGGPVTVAERVASPSTDQTGAFWFFNPANVELLVKMFDATTLPQNPAFWVFYGAMSDVEYWIEVTDTVEERVVEYHNLPGTICGIGDTGAFPDVQNPLIGTTSLVGVPLDGFGSLEVNAGAPGLDQLGSCVPSNGKLCLLDGRFQVEVDFFDQHNQQSGVGTAVAGTNQTGFFWFFNPNNLELAVKMVDGTVPAGNGHFWVFWGGLSDVEYHIRVTDTVTSEAWDYTNAPGNICGGADTRAF